MQDLGTTVAEVRRRRRARANLTPIIAGQALSIFGDYLAYFTLPWFILQQTGRALDLGLVSAFETIPLLLFGVTAGVILDRYRTRRIIILADLVRAATFFVVAIGASAGAVEPWMIFLVAFLAGSMATVFDSGLQTLLPAAVGDDLLVSVNSKLSQVRTIAWPLGVAVAGILVSRPNGFTLAFAINSYTFLVSALLLWRVRELYDRRAGSSARRKGAMMAGVRYLARHDVLRWATVGAAITNFVFAPLEALLLKFVDENLLASFELPGPLGDFFQGSPGVGLFVAIQAALGAVGIAVAPRAVARFGLGRVYVLGMLGLGSGFAVVSVMESFLAIIPAGIAVAGVGWVNVALFTLRQTLTPKELLGRVIAASRTLAWVLIPLGAIAGGLLGDVVGLQALYLFGSLMVIVTASFLMVTPLWRVRETGDDRPPRDDQMTGEVLP